MGIVYFPKELQSFPLNSCAICQVQLTLQKATAGLLDAKNDQALACVSHFSEVELLIRGWADFTIQERRKYNQQKQTSSSSIYEGWNNARLDS